VTEAAELAGVARATIWMYLKIYGIESLPKTIRDEQAAKFKIPKWSDVEAKAREV
jgi:hypothetical protein